MHLHLITALGRILTIVTRKKKSGCGYSDGISSRLYVTIWSPTGLNGYFNDTPVINVLRQSELGKGSISNIRYEDLAQANVIIGRKIIPKYAGYQCAVDGDMNGRLPKKENMFRRILLDEDGRK